MIASILLAAHVLLQDESDPITGWSGTQFGLHVCPVDDIDHDGTIDWAADCPSWSPSGRVLVYSGLTRALIHDLRGASSWGGLSSVDDFDGDGLRDLALRGRTTTIRSSKSGELLRTIEGSALWLGSTRASGSRSDLFAFWSKETEDPFRVGVRFDLIELHDENSIVRQDKVAGGGIDALFDVDRDGVLDMLVRPSYWERPKSVMSGRTGESLLDLAERNDDELIARPGERLLFVGDRNYAGPGKDDRGRVLVFSLDRKRMLYFRSMKDVPTPEHESTSFYGGPNTKRCTRCDDELGYSILAVPDLDRDGVMDVIAGAPGCMCKPQAVAISGLEGTVLWQHVDGFGADTGVSLANIGDVDGDHVDDVLIGSVDHYAHGNWRPNGTVCGVSGRSGVELFRITEASLPK